MRLSVATCMLVCETARKSFVNLSRCRALPLLTLLRWERGRQRAHCSLGLLLLGAPDQKLHADQKALGHLQLLEYEGELAPHELHDDDLLSLGSRDRRSRIVPLVVALDDSVNLGDIGQGNLNDAAVALVEFEGRHV